MQKINLSQSQLIALGFITVILIGTMFLMLPVASRSGQSTDILTALFTAVSSCCVTGLVLVDTATHWSLFGQFVIIVLIQIGGLGFVSIGVLFSIILRKKVSLKVRGLIKESTNSMSIGGVVKLTEKILFITFICEAVGAVLLSFRFIPEFGVLKGVWFSIFHSISAFCNAGFDLMGRKYGAYNSLSGYSSDFLINTVIMLLILIGGIGFIVWDDVTRHKLRFGKYRLHSKIVLFASVLLFVIPSMLFFITEHDTVLKDTSPAHSFLISTFSDVTARTAGFNTVDFKLFTDAGKMIFIIIMFIGAGSGSTAGGIKMTTFFILLAQVRANVFNKKVTEVFNRTISNETVVRAATISTINISLILLSSIIINYIDKINMLDLLFEVTSAVSTVGVTTGITRNLHTISKCILIVLMYLGRVGGLSFALSLTHNKNQGKLRNPVEDISIG